MHRYLTLVVALSVLAAGALLPGQSAPNPLVPATQPAIRSATRPANAKVADNSYCLTCHVNFTKELIAVAHMKAGLGCDHCHGESDKHSSDENGIIPPEIMFPKESINAACYKCHDRKLLLASNNNHEKIVNDLPTDEKFCTDCHGKHVMAVRTRRWDKVTGKLIADDGVRMVQDKPQTQPVKR